MIYVITATLLGLIQIYEYSNTNAERIKFFKVGILFLIIGLSLAKYL